MDREHTKPNAEWFSMGAALVHGFRTFGNALTFHLSKFRAMSSPPPPKKQKTEHVWILQQVEGLDVPVEAKQQAADTYADMTEETILQGSFADVVALLDIPDVKVRNDLVLQLRNSLRKKNEPTAPRLYHSIVLGLHLPAFLLYSPNRLIDCLTYWV